MGTEEDQDEVSENVNLDKERNTYQDICSCVDFNTKISQKRSSPLAIQVLTLLLKISLASTEYQQNLPILQKFKKVVDEIVTVRS